jgi:hypothetical protein
MILIFVILCLIIASCIPEEKIQQYTFENFVVIESYAIAGVDIQKLFCVFREMAGYYCDHLLTAVEANIGVVGRHIYWGPLVKDTYPELTELKTLKDLVGSNFSTFMIVKDGKSTIEKTFKRPIMLLESEWELFKYTLRNYGFTVQGSLLTLHTHNEVVFYLNSRRKRS